MGLASVTLHKQDTGEGKELMKIICWLAIGLFSVLIILCQLASYRFVNLTSTAVLVLFNVFFISLFFLLNGSPILKAGILTIGNVLGLLWNCFFYYILSTGYSYFGISFEVLFTFLFPILNIMWVVPFCSLTLSCLPKLKAAAS
jgi:hypothetical protein